MGLRDREGRGQPEADALTCRVPVASAHEESLEQPPAIALRNARAGVADKVSVRVGAALETLPRLEAEDAGPFDLVFIDADKENNRRYVEWALRLSRPGTVIIVDNVVRGGSVLADRPAGDPEAAAVAGTRDALALLGSDSRLDATAVQTVGAKGWDGFALAVVT